MRDRDGGALSPLLDYFAGGPTRLAMSVGVGEQADTLCFKCWRVGDHKAAAGAEERIAGELLILEMRSEQYRHAGRGGLAKILAAAQWRDTAADERDGRVAIESAQFAERIEQQNPRLARAVAIKPRRPDKGCRAPVQLSFDLGHAFEMTRRDDQCEMRKAGRESSPGLEHEALFALCRRTGNQHRAIAQELDQRGAGRRRRGRKIELGIAGHNHAITPGAK